MVLLGHVDYAAVIILFSRYSLNWLELCSGIRTQDGGTEVLHVVSLRCFILYYRACFATGSTARYPFFLPLHTVRDAPPWGTWLRTLLLWRKVGKDRVRRIKACTWRDSYPRPPDYKACTLPLCHNRSYTLSTLSEARISSSWRGTSSCFKNPSSS